MRRHVIVFGCVAVLLMAAVASAGGDIVRVSIPRLGPGDDYTYAVCPSAVLDDDGSLWLAVTVGRLVHPHWSEGYEQLRLYHYTEGYAEGWVVEDNRLDGEAGLFEACQTSLLFVGGQPLIAATATIVPPGGSPQDRFGVIGTWYRQPDGSWSRYLPIVGHSWGYDALWADRWVGDPVLAYLHGDLTIYWREIDASGGQCQWIAYPGVPGAPVVWSAHVAIPPQYYLADVVVEPDGSATGVVADGPPFGIVHSFDEYPGVAFGGPVEWWGPDSAWGRNPAFIRKPNGGLAADRSLLFETTPDLAPPPDLRDDEPVVYEVWLWGDHAPSLPTTVTAARYAVHHGARLVTGRTP